MRIVLMVVLLFACGGKAKPKPHEDKLENTAKVEESKQAPAPKGGSSLQMSFIDGTPSVEGTAYELPSKEAMIGATIVITGDNLQGEQVVITDERGFFIFTTMPVGKYKLTAYYNDGTTNGAFEVKAGKRTKLVLNMEMKAGGGDVIQIEPAPEPVFKTAYEALQHGALAQTIKLGEAELAKSPSSKLHAMLAIARYGFALEAFRFDAFAFGGNKRGGSDFAKGVATLAGEFDKVQAHLAEAAKDPKFTLELCVACMPDDGHMHLVSPGLFDIERDKQGKPIEEGDKRRKPTYKFDRGDIAWGRAMVSYQQALANIALAYDWTWVDQFMDDDSDEAPDAPAKKSPTKITIKLTDASKIAKARDQLLAGLQFSDDARTAYLAETDDDREWVPSPKQKNFASPLPVDSALYTTWENIVLDIRSLVSSNTGISFKALFDLTGEKGLAPGGFIDLGAMLTKPKNIVVEIGMIDKVEAEKNAGKRAKMTENFLKSLIGNGFKPTMKPSPLTERLIQLRKDMAGSNDAFEDKMKYFLWLN